MMKMALPLVLLLTAAAQAGNAVFLADGKRVARSDERVIHIKSLEDLQEVEVKFPDGLKGEYPALTRLPDGQLLVAGDNQLMTWDPAGGVWKARLTAPKGATFTDVACDPKSGNTLVELRQGDVWSWRVLPAGGKSLKDLFNRRAGGAVNPVFNSEGDLYFTVHGDVWKGGLGEDKEPDAFHPYYLEGSRIWPLAEHETSDANSSGVGANGIAPIGTRLLVDRSRMGGSGWGELVRVPNEDAFEKHLPLQWEVIDDDLEAGAQLAVSPDGRQAVAYHRHNHRWYLLETAEGKLVPLPEKPPAEEKK